MKRILVYLSVFLLCSLLISCNKLEWSNIAPGISMGYEEAVSYCENLSENGHDDWRLPNIDELRSLIKNRKTETGGECKVSEEEGCLSSERCFSQENCAEGCYHDDYEGMTICEGECVVGESHCNDGGDSDDCYTDIKCDYTSSGGKYSKLEDTASLLSSSIDIYDEFSSSSAWVVHFNTGRISHDGYGNVRCVRQKD